MWSSRWRWWAAALAGLFLVGLAGFVARRGVRSWWWDSRVGTPIDAESQARLDRCEDPGFETWVRVITGADDEVACGEPWVVRTLAVHAVHGDQAAWLAERIVAPSTPDGGRLRAAVALVLADRIPPLEPAWLRLRVSEGRAVANRDLYADEALAPVFGPAGVALGLAERAVAGDVDPEDLLPALRWLAQLRVPEADDAVLRAVAASTGLTEQDAAQLRARHARGAPLGSPEIPGRGEVAELPCAAPPCVDAAMASLEALVRRAELDAARPMASEAPTDRVLDALLTELGWSRSERLAMDWLLPALRAWVQDHPERVRSLWARPTSGSVLRLGWDGGGPPFLAAVVVDRLTPEAVDPVRSDRADTAWLQVQGTFVARTCGVVGLEPPTSGEWTPQALYSRAAMEAGPVGGHLAARLDPSVPTPPPVGDPVANAIGRTLLRTASAANGPGLPVTSGFCAGP